MDPEGAPGTVPVRGGVGHAVASLVPRDRVRCEELRGVLAAAPCDVEPAGVGEVAGRGSDEHLQLDLVDVHALALAEGQLAAVHRELQAPRRRDIVYSRFTKPAKQLIELAGSVENAEKAIKIVADWANSRKLDYAIETVFKKWLELDRLKPKEIVKKPFYRNDPMAWSETRHKWYVITGGEWLEYCDKEEKIEWRIVD